MPLLCKSYCSTVVSNAADGRRMRCMTTVNSAVDDRRTMNILTYKSGNYDEIL
ncbi:MAG: hypothetical protein HXL36_09675 [Prevotellaceae bacterium]|nr:hypothetical protein [Prevotellaceae bacterium]